MNMIKIINDGKRIEQTNYWDTDHAKHGLLYLSWNASAARLLIPDPALSMINEMETTKRWVIISRGKMESQNGTIDALELLFDDETDNPFALYMDTRQSDRLVPDEHKPFTVDAWTRKGLAASWPGRYRVVESLPYLKPWIEH